MIELFPSEEEHATRMAIDVQRNHKRARLGYAFDRIFHRLRRWVRAYPTAMDDKMPAHRIEWLSPFTGEEGPHDILLDEIRCEPALWWDALPDDLVLIPKGTFDMLVREAVKAGDEEEVTRRAQQMAVYSVENAAAKYREQLTERRALEDERRLHKGHST